MGPGVADCLRDVIRDLIGLVSGGTFNRRHPSRRAAPSVFRQAGSGNEYEAVAICFRCNRKGPAVAAMRQSTATRERH
jgi:hypothetical protein